MRPPFLPSSRATRTHSLTFVCIAGAFLVAGSAGSAAQGPVEAVAAAGAAEACFAKHDAFVQGSEGYHTFRIPGLVVTTKGTLLLFCDGRVNGAGDLGKIDLVLKRSLDGGKTWEKLQVLSTDPGTRTKIGNVSAVVDHSTGAVHAIFCKDLIHAYCLTSTDDGATFLPAVEITPAFQGFDFEWKYFATGHAHGIQLASGRLVTPVFLSGVERTGHAQRQFRVGVLSSDDHGRHWQPGGLVPGDERLNENSVFEAGDGSIVLNARSIGVGRRMLARSADAGRTWSAPAVEQSLYDSTCQASTLVVRDPQGKRVVLFANPAGPGRKNLTVRLSYDDGQTWPRATPIEPGPSAYSDLAAGPDAMLYLAYENGEKGAYERLSVARFNLPWLLQQSVPAPAEAAEPRAARPPRLSGIVVDDDAAELTGTWVRSRIQHPLVGGAYRHDGAADRGRKSARFTPDLPAAGEYEVRLLYEAHANRAPDVPVTVVSAEGEKIVTVDQREEVFVGGVPRALGVFRFEAGRQGAVVVSNAVTSGFVIVDAVQFVPAAAAQAQREAAARPAPPFDPAQSLVPVQPDAVDGKRFDLVVVEATPGGIAMAVRAAREGLDVLLVNRQRHLGGILSSGLGVWDTLYEGRRAPIYDEARQAIFAHYRTAYGENSPAYRDALPGKSGHSNGRFEPRVAEKILTELVAREPRIAVLTGFVPAAVEREEALLRSVTLHELEGDRSVRVLGKVFADCSYEGDLAALAKVPYRVGREAQREFHEPHAGKVYLHGWSQPPTPEAATVLALHDTLQLRKFPGGQTLVMPESTGQGDGNVQAFNYRTILTRDPANRIAVEKPADYDPAVVATLECGSAVASIPNGKLGWNRPQLVGPHVAYVEGDWAARRRVMDEHWQATMGLLWYLQNDPAVPAATRQHWQGYGLAKDEFPDHGHRPYEFYVREARRIVGRCVFTEHDSLLVPGLKRAAVHADGIGVTEWYLDTHACTLDKVPGSLDEGKMMLHHETFPGQVPYGCLLPQGVDNLLVPVCLSATHVAWGTVRLEPTWMSIAESAAYAAVQAVRGDQRPAQIRTDTLLRTLAQKRVMLSFFNDVDVAGNETWIPGTEYFATQGFFPDYDARMADGLKRATAQAWAHGLRLLLQGQLDAAAQLRAVAEAERSGEGDASRQEFIALLPSPPPTQSLPSSAVIARAEAIGLMWDLLQRK